MARRSRRSHPGRDAARRRLSRGRGWGRNRRRTAFGDPRLALRPPLGRLAAVRRLPADPRQRPGRHPAADPHGRGRPRHRGRRPRDVGLLRRAAAGQPVRPHRHRAGRPYPRLRRLRRHRLGSRGHVPAVVRSCVLGAAARRRRLRHGGALRHDRELAQRPCRQRGARPDLLGLHGSGLSGVGQWPVPGEHLRRARPGAVQPRGHAALPVAHAGGAHPAGRAGHRPGPAALLRRALPRLAARRRRVLRRRDAERRLLQPGAAVRASRSGYRCSAFRC